MRAWLKYAWGWVAEDCHIAPIAIGFLAARLTWTLIWGSSRSDYGEEQWWLFVSIQLWAIIYGKHSQINDLTKLNADILTARNTKHAPVGVLTKIGGNWVAVGGDVPDGDYTICEVKS
jgi:hypothetical protein